MKERWVSGCSMMKRHIQSFVEKEQGRVCIYSRGIPAEICKELSDNDVVDTYLDFVTKYVLWDDVLDWERDIKDYGKKKEEVKRQRRLI